MKKFLHKLLRVSMLILLIGVFSNRSFAQITGTAAYYLYSNVSGGAEPWSTTTNSDAMNTVFGAGEWTTDYYETLDPEVVFGLGTCFIFMEGGDAMADELETFLSTNTDIIQDWVAAGGHLLLNAAPNEGDGMDFYFDGVHLDYSWYTDVAEATDPGHPIFTDYYLPVGTSWSGSSFGHAAVSGGDITPVIHDSFDDTRYVLAEKPWGLGMVLFGGMTPNFFHSPALEAANLRASIIAHLALCILSDTDVGVNSIISPANGCGLETETVTVKVRNYGFEAQTDIPVKYRLDGGATVTQTLFGTLEPGDIVEFTFTILADLSIPGPHSIDAWTALAGDIIISNDTTSKIINNIPITSTFPYYEDFEDGASSWEAGGVSSSWELGSPASFVINTPPPATPASVNSWKTDLDGDFNYGENSYVTGPCFDFTTLVLPYVELDYWVATYEFYGYDGARLEYSLDGGASWASVNYLVGDDAAKENWYNDQCYSFHPAIFPADSAWTRASGGWKTAHYDISGLAGETQVQFRIHFASTFFTGFDGFAFDNLRIQDPYNNDIGVVDLTAPVSGVTLGAAESVTVTVENFGIETQSTFDVAYQVDGGTIHTEAYTGDPIVAGGTASWTFTATEDFSADATYAVTAWTELPGDEWIYNDTLNSNVVNLAPVTGTDAYYINSSVYGGADPWGTFENQDAMNDVFSPGGWNYVYFETVDPLTVFTSTTGFVFLEGSDGMADELETFLTENISMVQDWVASGGRLFLNAAPNEGDGMDFGFDGVSLIYTYFSDNVTPADPGHPIFEGPFTPVVTDYTGGSFGHARVEGGDILPVILNTFDLSAYVLAEKGWGAGHVMFGGMTTPNFHSPVDEARNLRRNIIAYLAVFSAEACDIPDAILCDNIDTYTVGEAIGPFADWWTTWSGTEGGAEDGEVSDDFAYSGANSMLIEEGGLNDVILKLGNLSTGSYRLEWQMYIPEGKHGYYNIQESETPGVAWNFEVQFGITVGGEGEITIPFGGGTFSYPVGEWFLVEHIIDLDADLIQFSIAGTIVATLSYTGNIGAVDFFSIDADNRYYIDDVLLIEDEIGDVCDVPAGLFADEITTMSAVLHWDAEDGASAYRVAVFPEADMAAVGHKTVFTNSLTIPEGGLDPSTAYGFRVRAACDFGFTAYSEIYYFTTGRFGEISEFVSVYPNPTSGLFNVQLNGYENQKTDVIVLNAVGEIIYQNMWDISSSVYVQNISLDNIPAGLYRVIITKENGSSFATTLMIE